MSQRDSRNNANPQLTPEHAMEKAVLGPTFEKKETMPAYEGMQRSMLNQAGDASRGSDQAKRPDPSRKTPGSP